MLELNLNFISLKNLNKSKANIQIYLLINLFFIVNYFTFTKNFKVQFNLYY